MKTIPLTKGYSALVDDEDFENLSRFKWRALVKNRAGGPPVIYAMRTTPNSEGRPRSILMHSFICGYARPDHKDGDGLNNQKSNLRPATRSQQNANRRSHAGTSSPFLGVHWYSATGKWRAQITKDRKVKTLGYFTNQADAAAAYNAAALDLHGEFAHLNTLQPGSPV